MRKFSLLLLDITALYGALVITIFIRYRDTFSYQHSVHLTPFLFIFALWLFIFYITNLYDFGFLRNNLDFYSGLFRAIITTSAISAIFFYLIPIFQITPKTNLAIFITLFSGIVIGSRTLFNKANASGSKKPLLIVGVNNQSLELAKFVEENPQLGYELKYIMDLAKEGIKNVDQIIKQEKINTVVISPETYQAPEIVNIFQSWGNSSILVFLKNFPKRVVRGSFSLAQTAPVTFSASFLIVLNFIISKSLPFWPTLFCR